MLLLDEPTNHLDLDAVEALIHALLEFEGGLLIISHDEHLVNSVAETLWVAQARARDMRCRKMPQDAARQTQRSSLTSAAWLRAGAAQPGSVSLFRGPFAEYKKRQLSQMLKQTAAGKAPPPPKGATR